ncbi:MAG TPA: hypothetical protein VGL66_06405 [Caulobacteraceae bacterium]|jgi:hypothetical protein
MKGRPRKPGARYPSGQRVSGGPSKANAKPNREVIERRRRILGAGLSATAEDLRAAENPLDAMGARGVLDRALCAAGHAYAGLYRRAGLHARRVTMAMDEAPESSGVDSRRIQDMTPEEIAAVWRVVESRRVEPGRDNDGDPAAAATLAALWRVLGPSRSAELYTVCVLHAWPGWLLDAIDGKSDAQIAPKRLARRAMLTDALTLVRERLHPRKARDETRRDHPFLGGAVEQTVLYVDEEGRPDPVRSASGAEVTVVRRSRTAPKR